MMLTITLLLAGYLIGRIHQHIAMDRRVRLIAQRWRQENASRQRQYESIVRRVTHQALKEVV